MKALTSVSLLASILPVNALFFYMDATTPRCFYEELPKDTIISGHYTTSVLNIQTHQYEPARAPLEIGVTIHEIFDADHRVLNIKTSPDSKFTYTAQDSGDHRLCFKAFSAPNAGWLSGGQPQGMIKFTLDMAIGDTDELTSGSNSEIDEIVGKVQELNTRLEAIKREQTFQREREAEFRSLSDATNARVVKWSLIQLTVLGITCAWQLSHLRSFFIKQKLT